MLISCYVERGGVGRDKYKRGSGQTSITTNTGTQVLSPQLLRLTCIRPKCDGKQGSLEKKEIVLKIVILIVSCLWKLCDFNLLVECKASFTLRAGILQF